MPTQKQASAPLIREVVSTKDRERFIDFPYRLYKGNPYWIPPIRRAERTFFDPGKNPSFSVCKVQLWIVEKQGRVAGRIAGIVNELETKHRGEVVARFGWLEFEDDAEVSSMLLDSACQWARQQGAKWIKGPVGFSNLDPSGITVEGFEEVGTIFGPYHFPYYAGHLERLGFSKLDDALEHVIEEVPRELNDKLKRLEPIIEKKFGVHQDFVRSKKQMKEVLQKFFYILPETYKDLPTFVPLTDAQAQWHINDILPLMKPEYVGLLKSEKEGMVGFGLFIPSYAEALRRARGRLYPFGVLHILWAKYFHRSVNTLLIGIEEKWRNKGLNAILFANFTPVLARQKVTKVYLNPQLESNYAPYAIFRDYNPRNFRRRRLYRKDL
jgi:hypothetical protein